MAAISHSELAETCGDHPGFVCRKVLELTGSPTLAELARFFVADVLGTLLILIAAGLVSRVVRRIVKHTVRRLGSRRVQGRLQAVRRHAPSALLDTGERMTARSAQRVEAIAAAASGAASFVVWVVAIVMVLHALGVRLGPALAGAGLVGIALGFGAQSLIRDFLSGFFILIEDQFGVGDFIAVGQASGRVEAVTLRATRIRAVDGTVWHVPNGQITAVGNMSQHWSRALLDLPVAYTTEVEHARRVMKEVADAAWRSDHAILEEPEVWGVQSMGPAGIVIRLVVKTLPLEQWRVSRELRERIKGRFDEEGIEMPPAPVAVAETESAGPRAASPTGPRM